ncbi:MAG: outer membrane PBP1 activator LpoA protein [Alteromonadaceae bacterium]|jgi:outer membrane PBP1 activator LpoA protein
MQNMPLNPFKPFFCRMPVLCLMLTLLASCATAPVKKSTQAQTKPTQVKQPQVYSSDDYLRMAKQANDSPTYLLKAAQTAQQEGHFHKSLIIATTLEKNQLPLAIAQQLVLVKVNGLLQVEQLSEAEKTLFTPMAKSLAIKNDIALLKVKLYSQQNRYIESLSELFVIEKAVENHEIHADHNEIAQTIWHQLNQLPNISLDTFTYEGYTNAKSWIELVKITRLYAGQPSVLQRQLKNWYELHPMHSAMSVLPESFQRSLNVEPFVPTKIAVLLPFTGKFRKQAKAVRNGLLIANQDKHNIKLMFIDSELSLTTVEQRLQAQQVEFIIGPLRKEKVQEFAQSAVIAALPTLFLNTAEHNINQQHYFFGLNPEDEVQQAANRLFELGYNKPSIIAPGNGTGKRLSEAFVEAWLSQRTDKPILTPQISYFVDQAQMQTAVKSLLDVEQSKQRIKKIKSLINKNLKTESRNRKDIDVIYVIGNNIQTKLIKPLIDVNTSPFTTAIPVYASSRSHGLQSNNSDKRDLRSLIFTEIPWLLDSEKHYVKQRGLFDKLWPGQEESLRRLFALGYDSLYLIDRIAQLRVLNGLTERGMSGLISVDENGFIKRRHLWAQYNSAGQVEAVNVN